MDKKKDCKIPQYGDCPDLGKEHIVVGAKQLKKAVLSGRAKQVYLAKDADPCLTEALEKLCSQHQIQVTWVASMSALGAACGIEVKAAAAAALNP